MKFIRIVFALALCCAGMFGQTVSSSLEGIVVDPADAAVANAPVVLTNSDTKATRTANTDNTGTYRFLQVDPGTYSITVKANGFKSGTETGIIVAAQETHSGGKLILRNRLAMPMLLAGDEAYSITLNRSREDYLRLADDRLRVIESGKHAGDIVSIDDFCRPAF